MENKEAEVVYKEFNRMFDERFGNTLWKRFRRKVFGYTESEIAFLMTPFYGLNKNRPNWEVRITK